MTVKEQIGKSDSPGSHITSLGFSPLLAQIFRPDNNTWKPCHLFTPLMIMRTQAQQAKQK